MAGESVGLSLKQTELSVEAGASVTCTVTIRNLGTIVERFAVEVRGDAAEWAVVEPATVSLLPGHEREVMVRFTPPREPVPHSGAIPFAVLAVPKEGDGDSAAEEGELEVKPFYATTAGLRPRTSRGVRMGRHVVRVHNGGNAPLQAQVGARDPDDLLAFKLIPESISLDPGTMARIRVQAKPRRVRDAPAQRPFQVTITPDSLDLPPVHVDGFMQKRQVRLKWIPKVLGVIVALAVAIVIVAGISARPIDKSRPAAAAAAAKAKAASKHKAAVKKKPTKKPAKKPVKKKPTKKPVKHTTTTTKPTGPTTTTSTLPTAQTANTGVLAASTQSPNDVKCFSNPTVGVGGQLSGTDSLGTPTSLRTFTVPADAANVNTLALQSAEVCFIGVTNGADSLTQLSVWIPKTTLPGSAPGTLNTASITTPTCLPYDPANVTLDDTTIDASSGLPKFAVHLFPSATDPNGFLLFNDDASAKSAFSVLQAQKSLCWIGSATSPISAVAPFNWTTAVSYFQ